MLISYKRKKAAWWQFKSDYLQVSPINTRHAKDLVEHVNKVEGSAQAILIEPRDMEWFLQLLKSQS